MKVLELVDILDEAVESAPGMPLTNKCLVDKEHLLDIVQEIKLQLPEELRKAKWIEEERQKILDEAQRESDEVIKLAEVRARQMISEDEITKQANIYANDVISNAKKRYKDIKLTTQKYVDELLQEAEDILEAAVNVIRENKISIYGTSNRDGRSNSEVNKKNCDSEK